MATTCGTSTPAKALRGARQSQSPAIVTTLRRVIMLGGRLQAVNPGIEHVPVDLGKRPVALTCAFGLVSRVSQASSKVPIARREFELPKLPVTPVTATLSDGRDLRNSDTMGRQR